MNKKPQIERKVFKKQEFFIHKYYDIEDIMGSGTYGIVVKVKDRRDNKEYAIKKILKVFDNTTTALRTYRELKILKQMDHENILSVNDLLIAEPEDEYNDIYLITDKVDTDLKRVIYSEQELPLNVVRYIAFELARGLNYLHNKSIMHRDLKPGNILINSECELKICDFGLAKPNFLNIEPHVKNTYYVTTRWYRAPEIIFNFTNYDIACDIWSFGCILAEMLVREPLFKGKSQQEQLEFIVEAMGDPEEMVKKQLPSEIRRILEEKLVKVPINFKKMFPMLDDNGIDLMKKIFTIDFTKRIKSSEILRHPFFEDILEDIMNDNRSFKILEENKNPLNVKDFEYEFHLHEEDIDFRKLLYKECTGFENNILKGIL